MDVDTQAAATEGANLTEATGKAEAPQKPQALIGRLDQGRVENADKNGMGTSPRTACFYGCP